MGSDADIYSQGFIACAPRIVDLDAAVGGAYDAHVVAHGGQIFGQRPHHVGETTYFDEGINFGRYEKNLERRHGERSR